MNNKIDIPNVHHGKINNKVNWRELEEPNDPDDEQLAETPSHVVSVLGFDPLKYDRLKDNFLNKSPVSGSS